MKSVAAGALASALCVANAAGVPQVCDAPRPVLELPVMEENPRNGEGDLIRLNDGRIFFAYARFSGKNEWDSTPATIVSRTSDDGGETWSDERLLVAREGQLNVMSVSLLRLDESRIALFYLRKNSRTDCIPYMRVTDDDFRTLSEPKRLLPENEVDYFVCNNARVVRLKGGRIVMPLSRHSKALDGETSRNGRLSCAYSDDGGKTWRRGCEYPVFDEEGKRVWIEEPGVVELRDGRLYLYARTDRGRQWQSFSKDGVETWDAFVPSPIIGPRGPATITRLKSGELLLIWNDYEGREDELKRGPKWLRGIRAPLTVAISRDEGRTWTGRKTVETDKKGFFCYFAVMETDDSLLLHYYCKPYLSASRVTKVPMKWLLAR